MNSKILFSIIIFVAVGAGGFLLFKKDQGERVCPDDAKPCYDDSTVRRDGAACTFGSCQDGDIPVTSGDDPQLGSVVHDLPVPEAVAAVKRHIAEKAGVEPRQVLVLEAHEKNWPDSCLGLAQPEQMCAQVITPGYEVRAQAGGQAFHFRTNSDGSLLIQE